jgi:hypothetical protein
MLASSTQPQTQNQFVQRCLDVLASKLSIVQTLFRLVRVLRNRTLQAINRHESAGLLVVVANR